MSVPADYLREGEFSTEVADLIESVFLDSVPIAGIGDPEAQRILAELARFLSAQGPAPRERP